MKKILGLLLSPILLFGGETQPGFAQMHPSSLVGRWHGTALGQSTDSNLTNVTFVLEANGHGTFRAENGRTSGEIVDGTWIMAGDYLVVDGLEHHIGFVTFKVVSAGHSRLTLLNRFGTKLEFTKVEHPTVNFGPPMPGSASDPPAKVTAAAKPPMGWNSWDNFGLDITEREFRGQVDYVADHLKASGYTYMVIDAGWYAPRLSAKKDDPAYYAKQARYPTQVDRYGRWIPAVNKFPSAADGGFRALAAYVHGKGLKFGLHIQRGIPWSAIERNLPIEGTEYHARDIANLADACPWWDATLGVDLSKPGAQQYYDSCYELYASWGVDFVKVDDMSNPYHADEIAAVRRAIEKTGRPIVYSLSPGSTPITARYHVRNNADMWRISNDFWDAWPQLKAQFALAHAWLPYASEGRWPDLDMLPIGMVGTRDGDAGGRRHSRFTSDELRSMLTLWCLFRSPLFLGGDVTVLNEFESGLVTNRDVLEIDQTSAGCRQLDSDADTVIYRAEQPGGRRIYVACFNLSDAVRAIRCSRESLGLSGPVKVREVWSGRDLGAGESEIGGVVEPHGAALYVLESP